MRAASRRWFTGCCATRDWTRWRTKGAHEGGSFKSYVDDLAGEGIVTADWEGWIDEIRELGNDANHELPEISRNEAEALLTFVAMLAKVVYEYLPYGTICAWGGRKRSYNSLISF